MVSAENEAAPELLSSSGAACRRRMAVRQLKLRNKEPKLGQIVLAKQSVTRTKISFGGEKNDKECVV